LLRLAPAVDRGFHHLAAVEFLLDRVAPRVLRAAGYALDTTRARAVAGMSAYGRIGAGRIRSPEETTERGRAALTAWLRGDYISPGTHAGRYLAARGIGWLAAKRFRNVLRWRFDARHPSAIELPAILCAVHDARGNFRAVHRIFLKRERPEKFGPPMSFGPISGNAVHIATVEEILTAGTIVVAEGVESTASACALLKLPGWAAIAAGNLGWAMLLPPELRSVIVACDHDGPGIRAAEAAARRWRAEGRVVRFLVPDEPGADANDILQETHHG
jgi:hypothetical protein